MPITAKWGPMQFVVTSHQIVPLSGLKISQSVKTETQTSSDGDSVTNVKGKDAMSISFSTTYLASAGVDPRSKFEKWLELVGKAYPLYIGGKRVGPKQLTLEKVEITNTKHTNGGAFLAAEVAVSLKEYSSETTTKTTTKKSSSKSSSKKSSSKSSGSSKEATKAAISEKKQAMESTASTQDKATKRRGVSQFEDSRLLM